jgi:hypothetical protein
MHYLKWFYLILDKHNFSIFQLQEDFLSKYPPKKILDRSKLKFKLFQGMR